jgi:hypothetical protein
VADTHNTDISVANKSTEVVKKIHLETYESFPIKGILNTVKISVVQCVLSQYEYAYRP